MSKQPIVNLYLFPRLCYASPSDAPILFVPYMSTINNFLTSPQYVRTESHPFRSGTSWKKRSSSDRPWQARPHTGYYSCPQKLCRRASSSSFL